MNIALALIGVTLIILAIVMIVVAMNMKEVFPFGIMLVAGAVGGFLLFTGIDGINDGFTRKHQAIYRDLTAQGFTVDTRNIFAVGGNVLHGTEVDFLIKGCWFPFHVTKISGTWYVTVDKNDGNSESLTPQEVGKLAEVCP
jgi:hypothetical protein